MAVPKKKMSRSRTRQRKAAWKVEKAPSVACEQCGTPKLPHRACRKCGTAAGLEVIETDGPDASWPASPLTQWGATTPLPRRSPVPSKLHTGAWMSYWSAPKRPWLRS